MVESFFVFVIAIVIVIVTDVFTINMYTYGQKPQ